MFLACREGGHETVKILLDHYANKDITDHMDRLPRDVAFERCHHDIVELLDTYKIATAATVPLGGLVSLNKHSGAGAVGYIQPVKHKARSRKSKNAMTKDPNSPSFQNGVASVANSNRKPKARKQKGQGEAGSVVMNNQHHQHVQHQQQQQHPQVSMPSSSQIQSQASHQVSSDSSPLSTISPGSYSINSHHSPQEYDFSPPRYDTSNLLLPSEICAGSNLLNDFKVVPELYNSSQLIDSTDMDNLLSDWIVHHYSQQLQQQQNKYEIPLSVMQNHHVGSAGSENLPDLQNGMAGGSSPVMRSYASAPATSMKSKNLPMSPTHIQALQQHAQQRAAHRSPQHQPSDFITSFQPDGTPRLVGPQMAAQTFSGDMQHKMVQPQQQVIQQQQQQTQGGYAVTVDQYPTPPSHSSQHITDSPPNQHNTMFTSFRPDQLLTPSPDSPSHWSSSSPRSAQSDWSEGISSPAPAITGGPNLHRKKRIQEHAYF